MSREEAIARRKRLDHERYMRNREERKKKQREYYAAHREKCKKAVIKSQYKRLVKLKLQILGINQS